jgi:hypothetical protein
VKDLASRMFAFAAIVALIAVAILGAPAAAQTSTGTQVTGEFVAGEVNATGTSAFVNQASFQCRGEPVCTGTYQATVQDIGCSNTFPVSGALTITGMDLSHAGPLTLNITLSGFSVDDHRNADGTCSPGASSDFSVTVTGAWDGTSQGSASVTFTDPGGGSPIIAVVVFTAARNAQPVFPMTVSSNITAATATVTAQFQPRPEDVGKQEGVFVFAHAPASRLAGTKRAQAGGAPVRNLDAGDPCVLAAVGPNGQLLGASASSLSPAFTTVLGAQGQSLSLLNNAPTPGVAGATIFAGYGQDAGSMLNGGVYQGAVTVPGAVTCGTILNASAVAKSPDALSGLWSAPPEQGWGIYFSQRRNILFAAWFTYDGAGKPKWYVASSCAMPAGVTGTSGTCNGDLFEVSGPVFFGVPFDSSRQIPVKAGSLQVRFTDAENASMSYTVAGQTRTVAITRQPISSTAPVAVNFTDLWFNPAESGWGMAVTQQYGKMFLAWFVYDGAGKPTWYVGPDCTVSGNSCTGQLYSTTGPAFGPTFNPLSVVPAAVGTVKLDFTGPNDGTVIYTVNGVSGVKSFQRQAF